MHDEAVGVLEGAVDAVLISEVLSRRRIEHGDALLGVEVDHALVGRGQRQVEGRAFLM